MSETYDTLEKKFTAKDCRIANLHGWYTAIKSLSSSPRFNKLQLVILKGMAYPVMRELEELGLPPDGGRENSENDEYYTWLDAHSAEEE